MHHLIVGVHEIGLTCKQKQQDSNYPPKFEQCSMIMVEETNHQYGTMFEDCNTIISHTRIHLETLEL
jgi:signal recognition particle subunit SEC65